MLMLVDLPCALFRDGEGVRFAGTQERTRVAREEQKRKKEHQKKVKQQLEEDKMIRKMKPIVAKAGSLSVQELKDHATSITTFMTENGRC
jgi:hypothetical protein